MTTSYCAKRYKSRQFLIYWLCLNQLHLLGASGSPSHESEKVALNTNLLFKKTNSSLDNYSSQESAKEHKTGHFALNLNTTGTILISSQSSSNQNRTNRGIGNTHKENSLNSPKPSLWESFKINLFPKVAGEQNKNVPQKLYNYNHEEDIKVQPKEKRHQEMWSAWEKIKSAARKSKLVSYLTKLGDHQNADLKQEASHSKPHTERYLPLGVEVNVEVSPDQERGKLIHDSLKTFLNIQNGILNYILDKHGQPLLKTTSVQPTKQPSLSELFLKPLSNFVNAHQERAASSNTHHDHEPKAPANDLTTSHSENHKVLWNAWQSYPWKENPTWDPWSYNYHVQRPATEGTVLRFWKKLLWDALKTKTQIIKAKAGIVPLLVKIKINTLKRVLERIANKEQSPTFLLLRVIKNALWKGKKAFLRQFLKTKNNVSLFKSKLKYFKHTAPTSTETSYGSGQDISEVHLTYNSPSEQPPPESYHSSIRPSWSSESSSYLLPPVVTEKTNYHQPLRAHTQVVYTSDYQGSASEANYGEIVPVPIQHEKTKVKPADSHSHTTSPVKKGVSFSSQLLQLKLNH